MYFSGVKLGSFKQELNAINFSFYMCLSVVTSYKFLEIDNNKKAFVSLWRHRIERGLHYALTEVR